MRRVLILVATMLVGFGPVASASSKTPPPKKYKNCTELRKVYPRGVARDLKSAGSSGATVDAGTYKLNAGSDRDKDGIACE
jgi:hypothetical protein